MDSLDRITTLRRYRCRGERDDSISRLVRSFAETASRRQRQLGELSELWQEVIPWALAGRTSLVGLRGGILEVRVDSSSVRFELDRLLRGGALEELRRRHRGSLLRIKIRIGENVSEAR